MKTRDIFIALLVPIILGFGFVIAKPAMQYFPPYLLMGMRFTIPALMLVWWFPLPKGTSNITKSTAEDASIIFRPV